MDTSVLCHLGSCPDVLTVRQVQDILSIGRVGIYKLIESGELFAFRVGHAYKIPKSSLLTYLSGSTQPAGKGGSL